MRLRTKLFTAWATLTLLLWVGVFWTLHGTVAASFDRGSHQSFIGTKRALQSMQAEHTARMRQASYLIMQIPELRALIAEQGEEFDSNSASLAERMNYLAEVLDAAFVCTTDATATLIAHSDMAPWDGPMQFSEFVHASQAAKSLMMTVYGLSPQAQESIPERGAVGLWAYRDRLYQVVAVPLTFQQGEEAERGPIEGALLIGSPLTDALAATLGEGHDCEVTFMIDRDVTASSMPDAVRHELEATITQRKWGGFVPFTTTIAGEAYQAFYEPLIDPSSNTRVGSMLIQRSLDESHQLLDALSMKLLLIMSCGLVLAALGSFLLSTAITRPIQRLVHGVRRVAEGDLHYKHHDTRRDELGELARAFDDMVEQVRNRQDLERRVVEVEAATRTKSEFLANMSHEIRTPMTAILGYADLLRDPQQDPSARMNSVNVIWRNGNHLLSIINDILDLSKIEAGQLEIERIECDPCEVLRDVASLMRVRAMEKDLHFAIEVQGAIPQTIISDPTRLRQILINLTGNAIKFTKTGSVRVVASMALTPDDETAKLQFQVIDSGIGMDKDRIDRIFTPFSQADASITRRFGGTGLGLSICRRLTEMLGGAITADSTPNVGSIFTVTIATGDIEGVATIDHFDEAATPNDVGTTRSLPSLRGRVLLADDGYDNRELIGYYLRAAGAEVTTAENGRIAVECALDADQPFDVILMDMQMPVMDGLSATARLRKHHYTAPIIALTANAMPEVEADCRRHGCTDYLSKPVTREQLINTLRQYLGGADADGPDHSPTTERLQSSALTDDAVKPLIKSYIADLPHQVFQIESLLRQQDMDELARLLHAIKGSGGTFGFMPITEHALAAEHAIRAQQSLEDVFAKVENLIEIIRKVEGYEPSRETEDTRPTQ